jgi:hypothetical protein
MDAMAVEPARRDAAVQLRGVRATRRRSRPRRLTRSTFCGVIPNKDERVCDLARAAHAHVTDA